MLTYQNVFLRLITLEDKDLYFMEGFLNPDPLVDYFTGTNQTFEYDQIVQFIDKTVLMTNRKHFLIFSEDELVGELVLSNIDENACDFRIAIFKQENFNKKYGSNAMIVAFHYAFTKLDIETISLEVYDYNERGRYVYRSFGFTEENEIENEDGTITIEMILHKGNYKYKLTTL